MADDDFDIDIDAGNDTGRDDADERDDEDGDGAKPKPEAAERDRLRNAVKATRKERDALKGQLDEMRRKLAELERGKGGDGGSSKDDAERDREADERAFTRYRPVLVRAAAESALVRAGAKPDRVGRLTRLLEVDDVAVDEKGNVDADDLAAEVDRLKEEMPELFKSDDDEDDRRARRPAGSRRVDGGKGGKPPATSSTAKLAAALTGRR